MSEPTPPPPPAAGDSGNRTLMLVLAYLFPLSLIPLLTEKEDREVQWHAKHGLVLTAAEIVIGITLGILSSFLACIGCIIAPLVFIPFLVIRILCIVKGMKGERFIVPGISQFADRF